MIGLIVAYDSQRGIGRNGRIPWKLLRDIHWFKKTTIGEALDKDNRPNSIIMGRKTWESLPIKNRPLKKRINIVVSKDTSFSCVEENVKVFRSVEEALKYGAKNSPNVFVIGGGQIYRAALSLKNSELLPKVLYITEIKADFKCDTFFPTFEKNQFKFTHLSGGREDGCKYTIGEYCRV